MAISVKRLNGYLAALKKHNIPADAELIISYDFSKEKIAIYVNHLINLKNPPDAIFAINDPTAIDTIQIIKKNNLSVPEDIAVVGFSDDYISALIDPPLTTVTQPVREIGIIAAQLLFDQIKKDSSQWKTPVKVLKTKLIIRKPS